MSLINDALKRAATIRALPNEHQGGLPMQPVHEEAPRNTGNPMTYGIVALVSLAVITVSGLLLKSKTAHLDEAQAAAPLAAPASQHAAVANPASLYPVPIPVEAPTGVVPQPVQVTTEPVTLATPAASAEPEPQPVPAAQQQIATPAPKEEPSAQLAATTAPAPTPAKPEPAAQEAPEIAASTAAVAPEPAQPKAPVVPAKFPELQLQAIHYRLKGPSAILNGKTVRVGQNIEGAKISAIHRYGVEVTWKTEKKFLTLD